MRLKSLELIGFKSFCDRTVVNFEEGVTGIVGPNGCGKSNVVDAIRWVMGEQSAKHLRGSSMGDVIFNGTENKPPMGMASVVLTFDNSDGRAPAEYADYSEIMIGRRLYRSGESEYFINKTPCRLKDIIDLFLGTGVGTKAYAIVEQGMIGQIISAKPEDRRMLIEEAAGISKFKARKEAALRKMESTKSNISRLTDIISELKRQMNSLYRQAKKAERFKRYSDELREIELKVSAHKYKEMKEELAVIRVELEEKRESEVTDGSRLSAKEAEIETERINLGELEKEIDKFQTILYERQNSVQLTEAEINYKSKHIENLTSQIRRWSGEIEELKNKIGRWREDLKVANSEKVTADINSYLAIEQFEEVESDLEEQRETHHNVMMDLDDKRRQMVGFIESVSSNNSNLEQLKRRSIELDGWIAKDQAEIDNVDKEIEELEAKIGSRSGAVDGTKQLKLELEKEYTATAETLNKQKEELENIEGKIYTLKDELQTKRSRLFSLNELQNSYEGYQEGVKNILKKKEEVEKFNGILGTVNEILETKPEYENAVGAALGEKLQYVVVKSHDVGVEAIDYLKSQVSGRSTFVPLELRTEAADVDTGEWRGEGVVGRLVDHVTFSDDYQKIVDYLLNDVILVEDLNKGLNLWSNSGDGKTFVTIDGELINPAGLVTGGTSGDSSKHLLTHRREIRELNDKVNSLSSKLAQEEERAKKTKDRVRKIKDNLEKLQKESRDKEIKLINHEKDLDHLDKEVNYYKAQRDKLTVEIAALSEEKNDVNREYESAKSGLKSSSQEKAEIEETLSKDQQRENELREHVQELLQKKTELNLRVDSEKQKAFSLERDIERLISSIAEGVSGILLRQTEITIANQEIKYQKEDVESKKEYLDYVIRDISSLKEEYSEIKSNYDRDLATLREKEASLRHLRKQHEDELKNVHEIELSYTQNQEKLNYLVREIFDRYRVSIDHSYNEYLTEDIDLESDASRVEELKEKVDKIGSVNVDAITEYEEIKVRHDFMENQYNDLTESMNDLHKAIQKINKTSKVRFEEAFVSVNERFKKLFPKLFRGGKAKLILTDEQDVLQCGVDIIAQPPGKKLQSVSLLSGGEKALTAVALIFAIFLHKPSPFCLLDEVDAPLDDANIDRFNEMIREMTKLSQFILITHNKRTMELADTLYGVTMEERGASKLISISLSDKKGQEEAA